jgi:hypothetical protein
MQRKVYNKICNKEHLLTSDQVFVSDILCFDAPDFKISSYFNWDIYNKAQQIIQEREIKNIVNKVKFNMDVDESIDDIVMRLVNKKFY